MTRGDIVLVQERNSPAAKARPCVVVQRDSTIEVAVKVTACPLTSLLRGVPSIRPLVMPTARNGLQRPSEVQVDSIFTFERARFGPVIGRLDADELGAVNLALRRWLDL